MNAATVIKSFLVLLLICLRMEAAEFFVSTNGTSAGTGSQSQPWDIVTALKDNTIATNANHSVGPGDTIWLRSGRYGTGGSNLFTSKLVGTQANPITVRQYPGETAVVDGGIEVTGTWNRLWGFEITNSLTNRTTTGAERVPGLNLLGVGSTAINLVIHDTGHPGIGFWKTCGDGAEIHGCLIWGTGTYQTDEGWNGSARGSGIYTQNTDGDRYISDVISFKNFTDGIKAFTINAEINGYNIFGNVVFQNNEDGIFVSAGNIPAERMDVGYNYAYNNYVSYIGYVDYPQIDLNFHDNYFVSEYNNTTSFGIWQSLTITNNTFVTATRTNYDNGAYSPVILAHLPTTNVLDVLLIGNNSYFGGGTVLSPFRLADEGVVSFPDWQNLTGDTTSVYTSSYPTSNVWTLRTNKYEPGRSHLVVFNWENNTNIVVDISDTGLTNGQAFEIRDVQNYLGAPALIGRFYSNSPSVSVPLNLTACGTLNGSVTNFQHNPNVHTDTRFNAFVILPSSAVTYYVRTNGSDSADGSSGTPWLTVQKAATSAPSGSIVDVGPGTYNETVNTANANVDFRGNGVATVRAFVLDMTNITVQGFTLTGVTNPGGYAVYVKDGAHYSVVSNNVMDLQNTEYVNGIAWDTDTFTSSSDTNAASFCTIITNTIKRVLGATGMTIGGRFNLVALNTLTNFTSCDFLRLFGHTNRITQNQFLRNHALDGVGNHVDFIQTFGDNQQTSLGHIIDKNRIYDILDGQVCQLTMVDSFTNGQHGGWTFRNNIFEDIALQGSIGIPNVQWLNNLFVRCTTNSTHVLSMAWTSNRNNPEGAVILNNAFVDCGPTNSSNSGWYSIDVTNIVANFNLVTKNGWQPVLTNYPPTTFRWWEANGINGGNPQFRDFAARDYRLTTNSFLLNTGTNLSTLFSDDFSGQMRSGWSIGPFELPSEPVSSPVANATAIFMRILN